MHVSIYFFNTLSFCQLTIATIGYLLCYQQKKMFKMSFHSGCLHQTAKLFRVKAQWSFFLFYYLILDGQFRYYAGTSLLLTLAYIISSNGTGMGRPAPLLLIILCRRAYIKNYQKLNNFKCLKTVRLFHYSLEINLQILKDPN